MALEAKPHFETEAWGNSEMAYWIMMMMMIVIIPKKRTANENAARIRVDQQPKDITYLSNKKICPCSWCIGLMETTI